MAVHLQGERAVGVDVSPEQRAEGAAVLLGEPSGPLRCTEDPLEKNGVDQHQGRLEQVEGQHGDLLVLTVSPGQLACLAVAEDRVGAVPVLHHLEAFVDLPPQAGQAQVVGHEDGPHGSAQLDQGGVGRVLRPGPGETAQDGLGLGRAQAEGRGVLHHLVVLLGDQVPADRSGDDGAEVVVGVAVGSGR